MEIQTKLKINDKLQKKSFTFEVLILNYKSNKNSFNGKILGLNLCEWVVYATDGLATRILDVSNKDSVLEIAKENLDRNFDYTIVLLSKTPLITKNTIKDIMEYATFKEISFCKLPCGYVMKNKFILDTDSPNIDSLYSKEMDEFYIVETAQQFKTARQVLADRINTFHMENGVEIINPTNTYIEPFVDIESGVEIYPNNSLKGKTTIHSGVILKENNVIENTKVGANCCISGSQITESIIEDNVYISAYSVINNSFIGANSILNKGVSVNNYDIKENSKIAPNKILGDANDSNSGSRKSR